MWGGGSDSVFFFIILLFSAFANFSVGGGNVGDDDFCMGEGMRPPMPPH